MFGKFSRKHNTVVWLYFSRIIDHMQDYWMILVIGRHLHSKRIYKRVLNSFIYKEYINKHYTLYLYMYKNFFLNSKYLLKSHKENLLASIEEKVVIVSSFCSHLFNALAVGPPSGGTLYVLPILLCELWIFTAHKYRI